MIEFKPKKQKGFVYVSEAKTNRFFFVIYAPSQTRKAYVVGHYDSDGQTDSGGRPMSFIPLRESVDQIQSCTVIKAEDLEFCLKSLPAYCEGR